MATLSEKDYEYMEDIKAAIVRAICDASYKWASTNGKRSRGIFWPQFTSIVGGSVSNGFSLIFERFKLGPYKEL